MSFSFTLIDTIPATPRQIYDAWLDSRGHTAMTGSAAEATAIEGASFTAWGGYITGRNLTLEPSRRIVQSWRTTRFTANDPSTRASKCCWSRRRKEAHSRCTTPMFRTVIPAIRMAVGRNITSNR